MSGHQLLNANISPVGPLFLSDNLADSPFIYHGWTKMTNWVRDEMVVPVDRQGGFGNTSVFKVDLKADLIGKVTREPVLAAPTATSDTYIRWVDGIGHALQSQVQLKYGVRELPAFYDDEMDAIYYDLAMPKEEQLMHDEMVRKNQSVATRAVDAASALTLEIPLPLFWTSSPALYLHQHSLTQELQVIFHNRAADSLLEHDGTAGTGTSSFTSDNLRIEFFHVYEAETDAKSDDIHSGDGIVYHTNTLQRAPQTVVANGATSATIKIDNITLPCRGIVVICRLQSDLTTAPRKYYDYKEISTLKGTSAGGTWFPGSSGTAQTGVYNRRWVKPKYFKSIQGSHVYYIPLSFDPFSHDAMGHLDVGLQTNPNIVLTWTTALSGAHVVDIIGICHDVIQNRAGDLLKNFI